MVFPKKIFFYNHHFMINEHVYEPAEDTFLIAENLKVTKEDVVLDMGTGSGILAILIAKKVKNVVATDINPYAIECARKNAEINCVEDEIEFRKSDLFGSIKKNERFSLILFNSPYLPSMPDEKKNWINMAWAGGLDGRQTIDKFITSAPLWLTYGGKILLIQSSLSNVERTLKTFYYMGLHAKIVAQVKVPFEKIVLIEAKF